MREESHLEDMRAAIRGDFERLEERRGEQELMRPVGDGSATEEPEAPATTPEVTAITAEPEPVPESEPVPEPIVASEPDASASEVVVDEQPQRSWLDRVLGR